jgi:Raf kinase inhibitor-like YbhB/YbcL family protein
MQIIKNAFAGSFCLGLLLVVVGCQPQDKAVSSKKPQAGAPATIQVQSPAFTNGQPIPRRYATEEDVSPPLSWSPIPDDTRSVAIIVEDPDAEGFSPRVHWVIYNIAPSVKTLPENRPHDEKLREPFEARQGKNSNGKIGYLHPDPQRGDKPHHYYFQVYALDRVIPAKDEALSRDDLLKLMDGHVLAKGVLVGTYQHPSE